MKSPNSMIHILLVLVLMIYVISDILVKNWSALVVMIVIGGITYYFDKRKNIILMMMIIMGCVYRSFFEIKEGMTKRKKKKLDVQEIAGVEGMLDKTMKQHKQLLDMATQLQPLMNNANKMISSLPEGFLDKALAKM